MLILDENFRMRLEAFASELFIYIYIYIYIYTVYIHCPPKVWKHPWQSVVLDDIRINPYHFLVQIH